MARCAVVVDCANRGGVGQQATDDRNSRAAGPLFQARFGGEAGPASRFGVGGSSLPRRSCQISCPEPAWRPANICGLSPLGANLVRVRRRQLPSRHRFKQIPAESNSMVSQAQQGENSDWGQIRAAAVPAWEITRLGKRAPVSTPWEQPLPRYAGSGIDLPNSSGVDGFELPVPRTCAIDRNTPIYAAVIDQNYKKRREREEILSVPEAISDEA